MAKTLSVRGFELASILDKPHGDMQLILKIMDLENKLEAISQGVRPVDAWPAISFSKIIEIAEWVLKDGKIRHPPDEETWILSLTSQTGLDVRAIDGPLPTEVGLFCMRIVYKKDGEIRQGTLRVWVVEAKD
jgi:hypothetical protein